MNLPNQIAEPPELATSHYWESRATTAEEKVKDWSVRACEAEERIRELEAENHNLKALIVGGENWTEKGAAAHLAQRIAKAKAILTHSMSESREFLLIEIGKALEALEGRLRSPD